jgi:beta-xylosidase
MRDAAARVGGGAVVILAVLAGGLGCSAEPDAEATPDLAPFLIDQDFADPDVVEGDSGYVAFATENQGANVQFATSTDLASWDVSTDDALPVLPEWASAGRTWAPDVSERADGSFVMYFSAEHAASGRQCIGSATSASLTGPYVAVGAEPMVCPLEEGGAIDPAAFVDDDGSRFLLWKNDGNCCELDTWIQIAPVSADGTQLAGPATRLVMQTEDWEGHLVEAPVLVKRGGTYVLLYSANDYGSEDYAIGAATAPSLRGPFEKLPDPVLSTSSADDRYLGPGGQDIVSTPGGDVLVFHGWDDLFIYRGLAALPLDWEGATPSVRVPTSD